MGFANHRRKVNSKNKNDEKNSSLKIIESKEKEIFDNNINNDSKEENEEEKNKRLYRQLMAKKLGGADNHRLYISNSSKSFPRKNYRTFTEQKKKNEKKKKIQMQLMNQVMKMIKKKKL